MRMDEVAGSISIPYTEQLVLIVLKHLVAMEIPVALLCHNFRNLRALGLKIVDHISRFVNSSVVFEYRESHPATQGIEPASSRNGRLVVVDNNVFGLQLNLSVLDF